jgi:YidC/Oxa1 family membrane protein insertase
VDVLSNVREELADSVDYGFFKFLAVPLHKILNFIHGLVGNWGVAILLLTLLIKILTWPITHKSYANTERMKEIQPKLDELKTKYENDQQRLTEETMKLFSENKFNPLGGCLPMVLQMPIFYGLYVMIVNSVELYQAEFIFWYTDLSDKDPYFVLPILMGVVMVVQQKFMMTTAAPNPQTKIMMQVMPIMFTAFMLFLPSGLVLYYFLNLLLGVLQQWMIQRKFAKQAEAKAKPEVVA